VIVGAIVGGLASIVEVGMAVGGILVGSKVDVAWIVGMGAGAQAERRNKKAVMSFFINGNYMSLRYKQVVE
jgi:hypothetical protein